MSKIEKALNKSPISYFSDLFVAVMVVGWIVALVILIGAAFYSMVILGYTDVWQYVTELVTIPLSAGGAIWMIKNSVQHAIANNQGRQCPEDFPAVEGAETGENEQAETAGSSTEEADEQTNDENEVEEFG